MKPLKFPALAGVVVSAFLATVAYPSKAAETVTVDLTRTLEALEAGLTCWTDPIGPRACRIQVSGDRVVKGDGPRISLNLNDPPVKFRA